jgi:hypothetical protein
LSRRFPEARYESLLPDGLPARWAPPRLAALPPVAASSGNCTNSGRVTGHHPRSLRGPAARCPCETILKASSRYSTRPRAFSRVRRRAAVPASRPTAPRLLNTTLLLSAVLPADPRRGLRGRLTCEVEPPF